MALKPLKILIINAVWGISVRIIWIIDATDPETIFGQNGPHHRFQHEKLLYWSDLAHSRYLGSSKCVLECAKFPPPSCL